MSSHEKQLPSPPAVVSRGNINTRDRISRHGYLGIRFGFKKNILSSLSEGSIPVIFISMRVNASGKRTGHFDDESLWVMAWRRLRFFTESDVIVSLFCVAVACAQSRDISNLHRDIIKEQSGHWRKICWERITLSDRQNLVGPDVYEEHKVTKIIQLWKHRFFPVLV
jgi:hypothetical protein